MTVEILTPEKKLFSGEAKSVVVPATSGEMGILENHAPLITTLKGGKISLDEGRETYDINGGVLEVLNNNIIILAD